MSRITKISKCGTYAIQDVRESVRILVSLQDLHLILNQCVTVDTKNYCTLLVDGKRRYLHRVVLGVDNPYLFVDHRNLDKTDNRRENLRIATPSESMCNQRQRRGNNKSGYRGVCYDAARNGWVATITFNGKTTRLGIFPTAREAAIAYNTAAEQLHGEFARLNEL